MTTKHIDLIEFAAELGERFPDLPNYDIMLACTEYRDNGRDVEEDTTTGMVVLAAYNKGEEAGRDMARFFRFNGASALRAGIVL
jgi:hypothetical protein